MADPVTIAVNIAIAAATTAISNALAPTQKFEGPRLDDLRVQTSTYGKFRPIPFGTIAYAGNVFWLENNKIKETKHKESTGKGGPKTETVTYTYSATLAIGLGEGPIDGITRIWADNKLIYDVRPDADTGTLIESGELFDALTVYLGTETQEVNARMEADDPETPAYRGEAYVVIEDFQLEKFGRRIPNFTFEVVAGSENDAPSIIETFADYDIDSFAWRNYYASEGILYWAKAGSSGGNTHSIPIKQTLYNGETIKDYSSSFTIDGKSQVTLDTPVVNSTSLFMIKGYALLQYQNFIYNSLSGSKKEIYLSGGTIRDVHGGGGGVRSAYLYNDLVYIITGVSQTSDEESEYIYAFALSGGYPVYSRRVNSSGNYLKSLYINDDGIYCIAGTGRGLFFLSHDLSTEYDFWDLSGSSINGDGEFLRVHNNIVTAVSSDYNKITVYDISTNPATDIGNVTVPGDYEHLATEISPGVLLVNHSSVRADSSITYSSVQLSNLVSSMCVKSGLITDDIDVTELTDGVNGYVITSLGSLKSAIEPLQIAYQFDALESDYKLKFVKRGGSSVVTLTEDDLAAHEFGQERGDELPVLRGKESELPRETKLTYISLARDYESDMQAASRLVTESEQVNEINLPIVLSDAKAAQVAEIAQTVRWIERNTYPEFTLPYKYSYLEPSDVITVNLRGIEHKIRILQTDLGSPGLLKCSGVAEKTAHYTSTATGSAGQASNQTLGMSGPTNVVLLDLPILRDQDNDSGFYAAANGYYSGWPGGVLMKSLDGGQSYSQIASFVDESTIGYLTATPTTGDTTVIDTENTINVKLFNSSALSSVTEIAMLNGANAAAIGADGRWVIIKFQTATLESDGTYTLSNIIWGYKGTENNLSSLISGDTFVLLSSAAMIRLPANDDEIGLGRHYKAVTFGKNIATASEIAFTNNAESLEPYAPTHILGSRDGSSNLTVTWKRRTRVGGEWRDLVGASLGEDSEAYEIDFTVGGTTVTKTGITSETYSYTAAAQTTDFGSPQSSIITNIYQLSATTGRGKAGTKTL